MHIASNLIIVSRSIPPDRYKSIAVLWIEAITVLR